MKSTEDPVYRHSKREAIAILSLWAVSFLWTVPYCYAYGYRKAGEDLELQLFWGLPSWIVWGVAIPWVVCGVVAIGMCAFYIQDDDLEPVSSDIDLSDAPNPD
ncbi:DUF997 family protein [Thalassoglobus sp. JC818]|uniref:DUF997 family protein n=1 Tax=Thalassoglobus sp. JC818 TaxID=3232136 RepID=UPI00345A6811